MFELVLNNLCFWPVKLPRPAADGRPQDEEVLIQYRLYTRTELKAQRKRISEVAEQLHAVRRSGDAEKLQAFLREQDELHEGDDVELRARIVGWKRIADASTGEELAFSEAARDAMLDDEAVFEALRKGLYEASRGAVAKN